MKNAKRILALFLALLTVVSIATIGVSAAEEIYDVPTAAKAAAKLVFFKNDGTTKEPGVTARVVNNKIYITAERNVGEIIIGWLYSDGDAINAYPIDSKVEIDKNGTCKLQYADWHCDGTNIYNEATIKIRYQEMVNKLPVGDPEFIDVVFLFRCDDNGGHRYDQKSIQSTDPTHDEIGYTIYACACGAISRKDKVDKLPGEIKGISCGADFSMAKKGTAKIEPVIDMIGEPQYTVAYKSSNEKVATINEKGEITGIAIGKTTITCTVTYKDPKGVTQTFEDKVDVKVTYSLIQWILVATEAIITGTVFVWDLILDVFGLMK